MFQPIVEVQTGNVFAHEALVRCRRPEYSSPLKLFENAVEESACGRLGRHIREVAFETCGDVALFVNLHPDELASRWLVRPDDPLCSHGFPVYLEVTESAAFTHFDLCKSVLRELCRRTGAFLVVDDFGAGHSNLARVVDLEPTIIKLDLALIRDLHLQPRKRAVVKHLVNLCTELGAKVVAEGIEQVEELQCVRDLGVHYAQGFLLARPGAPPPAPTWPLGPASLPAIAKLEADARPAARKPPPPPSAARKPPPLPTSATSAGSRETSRPSRRPRPSRSPSKGALR